MRIFYIIFLLSLNGLVLSDCGDCYRAYETCVTIEGSSAGYKFVYNFQEVKSKVAKDLNHMPSEKKLEEVNRDLKKYYHKLVNTKESEMKEVEKESNNYNVINNGSRGVTALASYISSNMGNEINKSNKIEAKKPDFKMISEEYIDALLSTYNKQQAMVDDKQSLDKLKSDRELLVFLPMMTLKMSMNSYNDYCEREYKNCIKTCTN